MLQTYQEHKADTIFLISKEGEKLGIGNEISYISEFFSIAIPSKLINLSANITYWYQEKRNHEGKVLTDSLEFDCSDFNARTLKLYLDLMHSIKIDKISLLDLLEFIRFLSYDGKTGISADTYINFQSWLYM